VGGWIFAQRRKKKEEEEAVEEHAWRDAAVSGKAHTAAAMVTLAVR